MKTTIRLPLQKFEFIEMTYDTEMTPEAAVEAFNALQKAYKGGEGMTDKEVDTWIENMFLQKGNNADIWDKRTPEQERWLRMIKRILNRVKDRQSEQLAD